MNRNVVVAGLVAALGVGTVAHADSRAWTAAKKLLPAGLDVVVGVNAQTIRGSKLFEQLWPQLLAKIPDGQSKLDHLKTTCGLDVTTSIDSVVAGIDGDQNGAIIVVLKGVTQKDIDACAGKQAKTNGNTLTIGKDGALTKYSGDGDDGYLQWLAKDTFVLPTSVSDKKLLAKMTAGGITGDKALKAPLGAIKTDAAIWAVANRSQDIDQLKVKMSQGYGSVDLKAGKVSVDVHLVVDNAKAATDAAAQASQQLDAIKKSGQVPPPFMPLANALMIKSAGSELVIGAGLGEDALATLIGAVTAMVGH